MQRIFPRLPKNRILIVNLRQRRAIALNGFVAQSQHIKTFYPNLCSGLPCFTPYEPQHDPADIEPHL